MHSLQDFTIFLHGPSGSGKGELQRKLTKQYSAQDYEVHYISSGDLYREAFAKPEIADKMKRGVYFDTLEAIIPGLQQRYEKFVAEWLATKGKAVLILDGLIRRGQFINKEGEIIPSQIEQVASSFYDVQKTFPQFRITPFEQVQKEVESSKHLLIDIDPRDAELQMKIRANKELLSIRQQLNERIAHGYFPFESTAFMYLLLDGLTEVINAEITTENEFERISEGVKGIRQELANILKRGGEGSFANFFKELGVSTQLRDDDISPLARRKRIENYVTLKQTEEGQLYSPGFAAEALIEGLGYQFNSDGVFTSDRENCFVIQNGQSRGIELQTFQLDCEQVSSRIYRETAKTREDVFNGPEGTRRSKES